jgi:hypothetical protein
MTGKRAAKANIYIDDPSEAPNGVEIHEGPRGGLYYESEGSVDEDEAESSGVAGASPATLAEGYRDAVQERLEQAPLSDWENGLDPSRMTMEEYEQFEEPFRLVEAPGEIEDVTPDALNRFGGWPNSEATVPVWAWAREKYGVDKLHPDVEEEVAEHDLSPEQAEQFEQAAALDQALHREWNPTYDPGTDTIEVFRGTGAEHFQEELDQLIRSGVGPSTDEADVTHRAVESWTANPVVAGNFAEDNHGVVISTRVPVERVIGSWLSSGLFGGEEAEVLVAGDPDGDTYTRENVNIMDQEERWQLYNEEAVAVRNEWVDRLRDVDSDGIGKTRRYVSELLDAPVGAELQMTRIHKQGEEYCDVPGHCFETPSGLGGHVSATGHDVASEQVETSDAAHESSRVSETVSIQDAEQYGEKLVDGIDWDAIRERLDETDYREAASSHLKNLVKTNADEVTIGETSTFEELHAGPLYSKIGEQLVEKLPEAVNATDSWGQSPEEPSTLPMWAWAVQKTGNSFVHPGILAEEQKRSESFGVGQRDAEHMARMAAFTQAFVRDVDPTYDPDTDTVTMYRGVSGEIADELRRAKEEGNEEQLAVQHRALESWTADPEVAQDFGDVVLSARVPVENIATSWMTGPGLFDDEAEYVVASPEEAVYRLDDVHEPSETAFQRAWEEAIEQWQEAVPV